MPAILKSKKFQAAVVGVIATVLVHTVPALQSVNVTEVLAPIVAYILGQGIADHGKEAEVIKKNGNG